jgi:2-polyprenyl-3-methyl-5-hydroxy-6-metoxy-1,4-benzoquinol methylase
MDPRYGERYRDLFERHWWWRARTELIVDTLTALSPPRGFGKILDVGCGDALFFDRLAQFGEVEGVEPFGELIDPANPHRGRIYVGAFDERFLPDKQYGLVLMLDVVEHMAEPIAALRHALNLLGPDGILVVTVPAFMTLWTNHDVLNHHFFRYTRKTFRDVASKAGMNLRHERYLYHWTCPVKLGIRIFERALRTVPTPPKVPVGWINELLFALTRAEQRTLSHLPMPFGSSLLVVGGR